MTHTCACFPSVHNACVTCMRHVHLFADDFEFVGAEFVVGLELRQFLGVGLDDG